MHHNSQYSVINDIMIRPFPSTVACRSQQQISAKSPTVQHFPSFTPVNKHLWGTVELPKMEKKKSGMDNLSLEEDKENSLAQFVKRSHFPSCQNSYRCPPGTTPNKQNFSEDSHMHKSKVSQKSKRDARQLGEDSKNGPVSCNVLVADGKHLIEQNPRSQQTKNATFRECDVSYVVSDRWHESSWREQVSVTNDAVFDEAAQFLHSTFRYPLHSTLVDFADYASIAEQEEHLSHDDHLIGNILTPRTNLEDARNKFSTEVRDSDKKIAAFVISSGNTGSKNCENYKMQFDKSSIGCYVKSNNIGLKLLSSGSGQFVADSGHVISDLCQKSISSSLYPGQSDNSTVSSLSLLTNDRCSMTSVTPASLSLTSNISDDDTKSLRRQTGHSRLYKTRSITNQSSHSRLRNTRMKNHICGSRLHNTQSTNQTDCSRVHNTQLTDQISYRQLRSKQLINLFGQGRLHSNQSTNQTTNLETLSYKYVKNDSTAVAQGSVLLTKNKRQSSKTPCNSDLQRLNNKPTMIAWNEINCTNGDSEKSGRREDSSREGGTTKDFSREVRSHLHSCRHSKRVSMSCDQRLAVSGTAEDFPGKRLKAGSLLQCIPICHSRRRTLPVQHASLSSKVMTRLPSNNVTKLTTKNRRNNMALDRASNLKSRLDRNEIMKGLNNDENSQQTKYNTLYQPSLHFIQHGHHCETLITL